VYDCIYIYIRICVYTYIYRYDQTTYQHEGAYDNHDNYDQYDHQEYQIQQQCYIEGSREEEQEHHNHHDQYQQQHHDQYQQQGDQYIETVGEQGNQESIYDQSLNLHDQYQQQNDQDTENIGEQGSQESMHNHQYPEQHPFQYQQQDEDIERHGDIYDDDDYNAFISAHENTDDKHIQDNEYQDDTESNGETYVHDDMNHGNGHSSRNNDDNSDYQDRNCVEPDNTTCVHDSMNMNNSHDDMNNGSDKMNNGSDKVNNGSDKMNNGSDKMNNGSDKMNNGSDDMNINNGNLIMNDFSDSKSIANTHDYIRSNNVDNDVLTERDSTYSSTYGISDIDNNGIVSKDNQSYTFNSPLLSQPSILTETNDEYNRVVNHNKINNNIKNDINTNIPSSSNILPPFSLEFNDITQNSTDDPDNETDNVRSSNEIDAVRPINFKAAGGSEYLSSETNTKIIKKNGVFEEKLNSFGDVKNKYSRKLGGENVVARKSGRCVNVYVRVDFYIVYIYIYICIYV
jgi:X-X-X-Leu-X-X-Gly heptad repeat protein